MWAKTPDDRTRDAAVYQDPEYLANKRIARQRSGGRCQIQTPGICTGRGQTIDHIVPCSQHVDHSLANLRDACWPCQRHKAAKEGRAAQLSRSEPDPLERTSW